MGQQPRLFGIGLGIAMLLATVSIAKGQQGPPPSAGSAPVTVVNTPLAVTGNTTVSGSVAISNTPTVNAKQSGNWNVGIVGTPTVNIGSGNLTTTPLAITQAYQFFDELRTQRELLFDAPLTLVSLEVCTDNDIAVFIETDIPTGGNILQGRGLLFLGKFKGADGVCRVVNLGAVVVGKGLLVVNNETFFDASYRIVALGY